MEAGVLPRKQRPYQIPHQRDFIALVRLAIETCDAFERAIHASDTASQLGAAFTVYLEQTKNGDSRQVPLTSVALAVFSEQMGRSNQNRSSLGGMGATPRRAGKIPQAFLSKLFSQVADAAECPDLGIHDLRHEATSRLFEKTNLSGEEIMKITGHKDHRTMMRYFNLRASSLVDRLW